MDSVEKALGLAGSRKAKGGNENLLKAIETGSLPIAPERLTYKHLGDAFDKAIAHHLSLNPEQRKANSLRAEDAQAQYLGRNSSNGKVKDLLGKNQKLLKSEEGYKGKKPIQLADGRGVETTGLPLYPAYQEGAFNVCPNHAACKDLCLGKTSGNYHKLGGGIDLSAFKGPRLNSLVKTLGFLHDPETFAVKLHDEIQAAKEDAHANGNKLGVRLNVLSDIPPRVHRAIIKAHPDVDFYDYTKLPSEPIAPNHHYTYSSSGFSQDAPHPDGTVRRVHNPNQNWRAMRQRLEGGDNVAMAFSHKRFLPEMVHDQETGKTFRVIDGDTHDYRPMDKQAPGAHGVIVGLRNKKVSGKMSLAAHDNHGFFAHYDPQIVKPEKYERDPSPGLNPKTGRPRNGKILNPAMPTNRVVSIPPQGGSTTSDAPTPDGQRKLGPIYGPRGYATGGAVAEPGALSTEDYFQQFPGLEHHDLNDGETQQRRKWYESPKGARVPVIDKSVGVNLIGNAHMPDAVSLAKNLMKG